MVIQSVEGLLWNNESRRFYINPDLKPNTTRTYTRNKDGPAAVDPSQKDMVPQFGFKWNKYIESLDKKIIRNNRRLRRITVTQPTSQLIHLQLLSTSYSATSATDVTSTDNTLDDDDDDYYDDDE